MNFHRKRSKIFCESRTLSLPTIPEPQTWSLTVCFSAFEHLAQWQRSGHSRPDLASKQELFWPADSYLIVYRVREAGTPIQIVAVLHGARDVPAIVDDR